MNINKLSFFVVCLLVFGLLTAADVKVVSSVDEEHAFENAPLKGTVTVTHNQPDKVDEQSFLLADEHLPVELLNQVKISPVDPLQLSIYHFQLPGKPKGLYVLPSVSVMVGGKRYRSAMSSYEVEGVAAAKSKPAASPRTSAPAAASPSAATAKATSGAHIILKLEAMVDGKMPLYPGQRVKLVYRYLFNDDIELTSEHLPLLAADGLIKIGEKDIKDYTKDGLNVREITQEVEADQPGAYAFGPSVIEGYAYATVGGQRRYTSGKIKSEAPAVAVTVSPFPADGKPASFNGAVGSGFEFKVALLTSPKMRVGDEIALSVDISGADNLKNVPVPEMCCQPGFSGFFRLDDLPPVGELHGQAKNFVVRLRPLSEKLHEIPSVEFSYFDPTDGRYRVLRSAPIPIEVQASVASGSASPPSPAAPAGTSAGTQPAYAPKGVAPIEIEGIFPLSSADLHNKSFGSWWVLGLIPFGVAVLLYQRQWRNFLARRQAQVVRRNSYDLLQAAHLQPQGSQAYFSLINRALKEALVEARLVAAADISAEKLPADGLVGEVRRFLCAIEERRFAGHAEEAAEQWLPQAEALWQKIQLATINQEMKP